MLAGGLLMALVACGPTRSQFVRSPDVVHLLNVPFFPNTTDQCGPAALASVLNFWGKPLSPEEAKTAVYLPSLHGTLPMDLLPALKKQGLSGEVASGSFEDIKNEIRQGRPVIAYLDFGTKRFPIRHFLVVTGFDDRRHGLIVHSSASKNKFASYRRFNRGWKDTDHWMLTVWPDQSSLPVSHSVRRPPNLDEHMSADDYFQLGSTYRSQGNNKEAVSKFESAVKLNKHHEPTLMALGNLSFEAGDLKKAEHYFKRVLKTNPSHGGANNNLAMVYLKEGKFKKAETLASQALSSDYKTYAEDTLQQIRSAQ